MTKSLYFQAFALLLRAPHDDADLIVKERFPVPRMVICDQHGSQVIQGNRVGLLATVLFFSLILTNYPFHFSHIVFHSALIYIYTKNSDQPPIFLHLSPGEIR